jgi:hypothetical protein
MANDITRATGRETAAALNTIITGIGSDAATSATTIDMPTNMVVTIITGTTDNAPLAGASTGFDRDQVSGSWRREDS